MFHRDARPHRSGRRRRRIIYTACGLIGGGILFLIGTVFLWLFQPIGKITDYARAVERGERPPKPKIGIGREVNTLASALDPMRDSLEDRKYVERYIRTLTHEMKSPLAAIRGAADECDLRDIVNSAIDQARPLAEIAGVPLVTEFPSIPQRAHCDAFILRAAVTNLLENAIDFSPRGKSVHLTLSENDGKVLLSIRDHGTGLGLTLVKEAAELHGGAITLDPAPGGGTVARLALPAE